MLGNFSDKAIATKVRAMYRFRLTHADYEELMKKRTVGDVAAYLRDNTHYRGVLEQADPTVIHRGQLETLLRGLQHTQYQRLIAFNFGGKDIYRYLYLREEIRQLLALLRQFSGGLEGEEAEWYAEQYGFRLDRWLIGHTTFDVEKLEEMESWQELADFLGDSPYGKLVKRFPPDESGQIDLAGCEQAFYTYYYKQLLTFVDRELTGGAKKATREAVYQKIDNENIIQTYRLKRFFRSDEELIRRSLLPFRTQSQSLIDRMIAAPDVERLHGLLEEAGLVREGEVYDSGFIENVILRLRAKQSRWELHNSIHPAVVLYAYMTYLEIELEDIINIIESVRYGLSTDEMRKMLSII